MLKNKDLKDANEEEREKRRYKEKIARKYVG